jgi:hypothetical protein
VKVAFIHTLYLLRHLRYPFSSRQLNQRSQHHWHHFRARKSVANTTQPSLQSTVNKGSRLYIFIKDTVIHKLAWRGARNTTGLNTGDCYRTFVSSTYQTPKFQARIGCQAQLCQIMHSHADSGHYALFPKFSLSHIKFPTLEILLVAACPL